jgi:hypothetical protein
MTSIESMSDSTDDDDDKFLECKELSLDRHPETVVVSYTKEMEQVIRGKS